MLTLDMLIRTTSTNFIAPRPVLSEAEGTPRAQSALSFRPKGEIFLRSLAFARDDGPRPVTWRACVLARGIFFRFCEPNPNEKFQISLARFYEARNHVAN